MDYAPRNSWCLARVIEVITDNKGLVRVAKLKTVTTELKRPIHKLCTILESDII